jgi:transcription initiation factor TFIID TATA-box-binding protein
MSPQHRPIQSESSPPASPAIPDFEFTVENVVATAILPIAEKIDLTSIAARFPVVEYNPERFPGLIMRIPDPKATILLFTTGKMVITGMREESEAAPVVKNVLHRLTECDIQVGPPEITIQNVVASGDVKCSVDLNLAAVAMDHSMYEPEVFPGLIYRMQAPKAVFLVFSTGKIVCTGAKSKAAVAAAVERLYYLLRECGVAGDRYRFLEPEDEEEEEMLFI